MKIFYLTHGTINFEEKKHFANSLIDMGHDVLYYNYVSQLEGLGHDKLQKHIIMNCMDFDPDLVFCLLHKDEIDYSTLGTLRENGYLVINWFFDDVWRFNDFSRFWIPYLDYIITTSPDAANWYSAYGAKDKVIPSTYAGNPQYFTARYLPKIYKISFVGQSHGIRGEYIQKLKDAGIDVRAFGRGFTDRISFNDMIDIFSQSYICLNISEVSGQSGKLQAKARDFEIACTGGGCLLTGNSDMIEDCYVDGKEIVVYDNLDDLVLKAKHLIRHPDYCMELAQNARQKTLEEHTYQHRFETIFQKIGFRKDGEK